MKLTGIAMMLIGTLIRAVPGNGGEDVPATTHSRIILHGVDCSFESDGICPEERAVFDEASATLAGDERPVMIQTEIVDAMGDPAGNLSEAGAAAVRDYIVGAGGVALQQVEVVTPDSAPSDDSAAHGRVELQLSRVSG